MYILIGDSMLFLRAVGQPIGSQHKGVIAEKLFISGPASLMDTFKIIVLYIVVSSAIAET